MILSLAHLLLLAAGPWRREPCPPRRWASNNRTPELSAFAVGRGVRLRLTVAVPRLIALRLRCLVTTQGN